MIKVKVSWVYWTRESSDDIRLRKPPIRHSSVHLTRIEFLNINDAILFKITWG